MAGLWDNLMKRLVGANPEHFINWLIGKATFVAMLDNELKSQHLFADALIHIIRNGKAGLLHIEFQTSSDPEMEERLLDYNVFASHQYDHRPASTYVIYLRKGVEVAESPYIRRSIDGEEVHRFYFRVIKLWELPSEEFLQPELIGLFPLLTLTEDGKRPEVVKEMIDALESAQEFDLLAISQIVGGLVFKAGTERDWFRRRFSMFQDILRESWVYQEIGQEYLEQGREEERERRIQDQQAMLVRIVQLHFSELLALAKQKADGIKDPEVLTAMNFKLLSAQTVEEARRILLDVHKGENKQ